MEWISTWLGNLCFACQKKKTGASTFCLDCSTKMAELELKDPILVSDSTLTAFALFPYEGFIREVILNQKIRPNKPVCQWFAKLLIQKFGHLISPQSVLVIPGHRLQKIHFIEKVGVLLGRGYLFPKPILQRKFFFNRAQKFLNKQERKNNIVQKFYVQKKVFSHKNFCLLDDIITTGQTMNFVCSELEKRGGLCKTKISIAYVESTRSQV